MKKQSRSATAPRRTSTPPQGLAVAFKLLSQGDDTSACARIEAAQYYPYALEVIEAVYTESDDDAGEVIGRAVTAIHGGIYDAKEIAQSPDLYGDAGLKIGFAVCWLLLHRLQGGAQ